MSLRGDANNDNTIDIADALNIALYIAGIPGVERPTINIGDVNNDKKLDIIDAYYVAAHVAGLPGFDIEQNINTSETEPEPEPEPETEPEPEPEPLNFSLNLVNHGSFALGLEIQDAKNFIENFILGGESSIYNLYTDPIDIYELTLEEGVLGAADYANRVIIINNTNNTIQVDYYLNDVSQTINLIVMIHEILHIVGIGTDQPGWYDNITNYFYNGVNGFREYKTMLGNINFDTSNLIGIPIEDNFGAGTVLSHFEEGVDEIDIQYRFDVSGVYHPTFPREIMSGFINSGANYLSRMTLGVLEDIGFFVNYNSENIMDATFTV